MHRDQMDFTGLASDLERKRLEARGTDTSPQFTRRHYIWLTSAMRKVLSVIPVRNSSVERRAVEKAIEKFANILAADNPRFDKQQFLSNIYNHPTKG